jgi:hypothetical protein
VAFQSFAPYFLSHSLFQELSPAAHIAIEDFQAKHPLFEMPLLTHKVASLAALVKDSLASTAVKKGMSLLFSF